MLKEFKAFILRGNVMELAIGVIIAGAFGAITTSLVNDIMMPLIGIALQGIDFSGLSIKVGSATVAYGKFIQTVIVFLITAFVIFMLVKTLNSLQKKKEEAPAAPVAPTASEKLLSEIRDLLKK